MGGSTGHNGSTELFAGSIIPCGRYITVCGCRYVPIIWMGFGAQKYLNKGPYSATNTYAWLGLAAKQDLNG